jgi:hypothetical protein
MKRTIDVDSVFEQVNRRQVLKGALGVAVSAAGVSAFSGITAAHFHTVLEIEITPGSSDNRIDLSGQDLITVAVLTTTYQTEAGEKVTFDPTEKPVRYRFGASDALGNGNGARPVDDGQIKDVNGDGSDDLVLQFPVEETGFSGDETVGKLFWERDESGKHGLSGKAPVTIVTEETEHEQNTSDKKENKQKEDSKNEDKETATDKQQQNNTKDKSEEEDDSSQAEDSNQEVEQENEAPC